MSFSNLVKDLARRADQRRRDKRRGKRKRSRPARNAVKVEPLEQRQLMAANIFLDFVMRGSYVALFIVYSAGAMCLISMGLIIAARLRTEELADGLLNIFSWPMLLLSGVWFSMEGTSPVARVLSELMPLTHLVNAARAVMVDGAELLQVLPEILLLGGMGLLLLFIAAMLFRWD